MNEQTAVVQHRLDAAQAAAMLAGFGATGKLAPAVMENLPTSSPAALPEGVNKAGLAFLAGFGATGKLAPAVMENLPTSSPAALPEGVNKAGLAFLADPRVRIGVTLVTPNNARHLVAYGTGDSDRLAGFTPDGAGAFNLAETLSPDHVLALLATGLGLEQDIGELPLSAQLEGNALLALAGFADALRQRELEALLARLPKPDSRVTLDEIYLRTLDGMMAGDMRWSAGLLTQLLESVPDVNEDVLAQGMHALQQAGWAQAGAANNWSPTDKFALGIAYWQLPLAGARIQLVRLLDGKVETTDMLLLRMLGSLWLCRREGPKYAVTSPASARVVVFLHDLLSGFVLLPKPAAPEPVLPPETVAVATATERPRPRFCRQCGAPLEEDSRFCGACGAKI